MGFIFFKKATKKEASRGRIHGCSIARSAPMINHLFFADDSFLFFRADEEQSTCIKNCVDDYALASGQIVNFDKSSVSLSSNTISGNRRAVCSILHVNETDNHGSYLGMSSLVGRNRYGVFSFVKEMLESFKNKTSCPTSFVGGFFEQFI